MPELESNSWHLPTVTHRQRVCWWRRAWRWLSLILAQAMQDEVRP